MTTTQAKKKIAAARQMTAANQDKHRIHLERGYVYASENEVFQICDCGIITGWTIKPLSQMIYFHLDEKHFWAINSESKLVMI
jgi:hypothetical protein